MSDLAIALGERRRGKRLEEIERQGWLAYIEGAEQRPRDAEARPLTADELERVTIRYPVLDVIDGDEP